MNWDRWAFAAWLALIGLGLRYVPPVAGFIEGPARAMLGWVLGLVWAWFLAICLRYWLDLSPARRQRVLPWLPLAALGLFLLAWAQPLFSARLSILLHGVLGILAYRLFRSRPAGGDRLRPAALLALAAALTGALAQIWLPQALDGWRALAVNALAAWLLILICALLDPQDGPAPEGQVLPAHRPRP